MVSRKSKPAPAPTVDDFDLEAADDELELEESDSDDSELDVDGDAGDFDLNDEESGFDDDEEIVDNDDLDIEDDSETDLSDGNEDETDHNETDSADSGGEGEEDEDEEEETAETEASEPSESTQLNGFAGLKVSHELIKSGLNFVRNGVPGKPTLEVLVCAKLEAIVDDEGDPFLALTTADAETWVTATVPAGKLAQPGIATIPVKPLSKLVGAMSAKEVELSSNFKRSGGTEEGGLLEIKEDRGTSRLRGMHPSGFPDTPELKGRSFKLGVKVLLLLVRAVAFAMSKKDNRAFLKSIHFRCENNVLTLTATDGGLTAIATLDLATVFKGKPRKPHDFDLVIPTGAIDRIASLLESCDVEESTTFTYDKTLVSVNASKDINFEIVSQCLKDEYPNPIAILQERGFTYPYSATVSKSDFLAALKQLASFDDRQVGSVVIDLKGNGELGLRYEASHGASNLSLEATYKFETGSTLTATSIKFQIAYLIAATEALPSDQVMIRFHHGQAPVQMETAGALSIKDVPIKTYSVLLPLTGNVEAEPKKSKPAEGKKATSKATSSKAASKGKTTKPAATTKTKPATATNRRRAVAAK